MKNPLYLSVILLAISFGCNKKEAPNKFADDVLIKIADFQDKRLSDSLYIYLASENSTYRREAALAFASIQDSAAVEKIAPLLSDSDTAVRKAVAFTLGQIRTQRSAALLETAAAREKNKTILNEILEGYGKTTSQWKPLTQTAPEGLAWSLYRSGLNNAVDTSYNRVAATLLDRNQSEMTRLGAAHFFYRSGKHLEPVAPSIIASATDDVSPVVRMASARALRKILTDSAFMALEKIATNDEDNRVRINAIYAMQAFPFGKTKDYLLRALDDKNLNIGIAASEVINAVATEDFWIALANKVTDIKHWRIQANIYSALMRIKFNKTILSEILSVYKSTSNPYQKAALLNALQHTTETVDFIERQIQQGETPVVRSAAAAALVAINRRKDFPLILQNQFSEIYRKAIRTGDVAVVGIIAGALADPALGYKANIKDHTFLLDAKRKLSLPKDNETLQPVEAAIAYFEEREITPVKNKFNHPIDWAFVKTIPKGQRAIVKTPRGHITIRLLVEEAPGSVANFVRLAKRGYLNGKIFHRVVPNFVSQAGCPRGDGWGNEDYSIRSEYAPRKYATGSVGMASAGKDTEGTQWFITHSPTPHLDGAYTIFAEVETGIKAAQRLEIGDEIIEIEIVEKKLK